MGASCEILYRFCVICVIWKYEFTHFINNHLPPFDCRGADWCVPDQRRFGKQRKNGIKRKAFQNNRKKRSQRNPDMMGSLRSMLDSNNDGSVSDDVQRIAGNFFK